MTASASDFYRQGNLRLQELKGLSQASWNRVGTGIQVIHIQLSPLSIPAGCTGPISLILIAEAVQYIIKVRPIF